MKKFFKASFQVGIALLLLGVGVKFLVHYLGNMDEDEEEYREPYQSEEE